MLDRLLTDLRPQLNRHVRVLTLTDDGDRSIGAKRQTMLETATADYVSFVDDDDLIAPDYCRRILTVLNGADPPDVVGFRLRCFEGGALTGVAVHSYDHARIATPEASKSVYRYDRNPNHLNPIRREIALEVGYKPLDTGEDGDYAVRLSCLTPRLRETFLDWVAYHYLIRSDRRGERTHAAR